MHPNVFLDGFWRSEIRTEVFVCMSFDSISEPRWTDIFVPAIEGDLGERIKRLKGVRVDYRQRGDSILTEIIDGIAHSLLVLADISVSHRCTLDGELKCYRNGNVMYEVGLALACRQPVEVILIRDDSDSLLFDVGHIPVTTYYPTDPTKSMGLIQQLLRDRIREIDYLKDSRVTKIVRSLTQDEVVLLKSWHNLFMFGVGKGRWWKKFEQTAIETAVSRLLDRGVIRVFEIASSKSGNLYGYTAFGKIVAEIVAGKLALPTGPRIRHD